MLLNRTKFTTLKDTLEWILIEWILIEWVPKQLMESF